MTTPVLFIGGAGLPAWAWGDVRQALSDQRPTTVASRPTEPDASLADHALQAFEDAPDGEFVVVAHSSGGMIAAAMTTVAPGRLVGLIAVSAVVPAAGASFIGSMPFPNRLVLGAVMRVAGTRPPAKAIRKSLGASVAPDVVDRVVNDFETESIHLFKDAVAAPAYPERRGYIRTANDREFGLKLQDRFATNLGATKIETLQTGHHPMLEDPAGLAAAIERLLA